MTIKEYIHRFTHRPWYKILGDVIFWVFLIMLIIPSTRAVIFSGMAKVRALVMPLRVNEFDEPENVSVPDDSIHATSGHSSIEWYLVTPDGRQLSIGELAGEVILINQWATWCPPCRAEMPSLQKLYDRMGNRVTFVMVSPEDPEVVKAYIQKHGYTFPVYLTGHNAPEELASNTIPVTHIIDKKGRVVVAKKGAYNWNSMKVRRLLDKLLE